MKTFLFFRLLCTGLILLVAVSCDRNEAGDMMMKTGELPSFDTLRIDGPVNVYLSMDTANSITIKGNSSIVDGVHYRVDNGTLDLTSDYAYKMFKPTSNKPDIYLTVTSLSRIDVAEACGLKTTGSITAGELGLVIMSKYADVNLDLDCQTFYY